MIKIISDENKGVMVDASGRIDTIATEIVAAIQNLCDGIIQKDGREVGLAFSEAIISALEHTKGMRTEEILKSQALKPSEAQEEAQRRSLERAKKRSKEELKRAQEAIDLWNDIAGGKHGTD